MTEAFEIVELLEDLAGDWNALAVRAGSPLLTYEWISAAAKVFLRTDEALCIMAVRDQSGRLTAAAPLVLTRSGISSRLMFLGAREFGEPTGFLYDSPEALTNLVCGVLALGRPLEVTRLPLESLEKDAVRRALRYRGVVRAQEEEPSLALTVAGNWEDFERSITGSRRERLRRAQKRARSRGEVQFEAAVANNDNFKELFSRLAAVEALSWKGRTGTALSADERYFRFFYSFGSSILSHSRVLFMFLHVGEVVAAAQLTVVFANKLWILKIGYDESYADCSPGLILMHEAVHHAFTEQLSGVEFLGKREPWLTVWTQEERRYCTLQAFGINLSSAAGLLAMGAAKLRRVVESGFRREAAAA